MATIDTRQSNDGQITYRVRVRIKGHATQTATFSKLADARKWASITEGAVFHEKRFPGNEAKKHTMSEGIDRYMTEVLPRKAASSSHNQTFQLKWWKSAIGHNVLAEVSSSLIAQQRDRLRQSGKSNATVNRYLSALSHVLSITVREWEWLDDSPMRKVSKLRENKGRVRFLSVEERQSLLEQCKASRNTSLHTVVVLALSTGGRKNELLSLEWRDVDLKRNILTFRETKNGETRAVPLTGYALEVLKSHAKVRRIDTALVFPSSTGRKSNIRQSWEYAVKRAGITNFHFHDLRHSYASYLAMNGASLLEIAELLGHKTLAMVKRYAHLTEAHTKSVVERMNKAVFEKESMPN